MYLFGISKLGRFFIFLKGKVLIMSVSAVREAFVQYGVESIGMSALISSLVGIETNKLDGLTNSRCGELFQLSLPELETKVSKVVAYKLFAIGEIIRRQRLLSNEVSPTINSPQDVYNLLGEEVRYLQREEFRILLMDTKNHVKRIEVISIGTLNSAVVHPREVFKSAIRESSNTIILLHNHPSGDPTPSKEDIDITRRLVDAGEIIGITVVDHVIIGDGRHISLKERGII